MSFDAARPFAATVAGLSVVLAAHAEIPVVGWWLPEWGATTVNYVRAREAGFTHLTYGPADIAAVKSHLDMAAEAGIKLIVTVPDQGDPAELARAVKDHPAFAAYLLADEPNAKLLPKLGERAKRLQTVDNVHTSYINGCGTILECDNPPQWYGTPDLRSYIELLLETVPTKMLSFDEYPILAWEKNSSRQAPFRNVSNLTLREDWYEALEIFADFSRKKGLPFWGFALSTAFKTGSTVYPVPLLAHVRLQHYSNLAYGAQGLQYWAYWPPIPPTDMNMHTGVVGTNGCHTAVTDNIRRFNEEFRARSFVFNGAKLSGVWHTGSTIPKCTHRLEKLPQGVTLLETPDGGAVVSVLVNRGSRYLVVVNRSPTDEMTLKIGFSSPAERILENGRAVSTKDHDDEYWLDAGYAEIFKLPTVVDDNAVAGALDFVFDNFFSEKTSLVYTCPPSQVQKSDFFTNGLRVWRQNGDYGYGMEDCAILHAVALSGLVDEYEVTGRESAREDARRLVRGLLNLVSAHPYKGYVARGLCEEDGRSICALSSRDQFTHWVYGLWRYRHSRLYDSSFDAEIKKAFGDVADRMLRTVTEENGWMYGQADGSVDPRGITKMRFAEPHEAARLAMIYAAAWDATGDVRWREQWRGLIEEAVAESLKLRGKGDGWLAGLMNYALLQMNSSLELLLALEEDQSLRSGIKQAMTMAAETAREHSASVGTGDGPFLCSCAELALAQMMAPGFVFAEKERQLLVEAISKKPFDHVSTGSTRILHLYAAWWRSRRLCRTP